MLKLTFFFMNDMCACKQKGEETFKGKVLPIDGASLLFIKPGHELLYINVSINVREVNTQSKMTPIPQ